MRRWIHAAQRATMVAWVVSVGAVEASVVTEETSVVAEETSVVAEETSVVAEEAVVREAMGARVTAEPELAIVARR